MNTHGITSRFVFSALLAVVSLGGCYGAPPAEDPDAGMIENGNLASSWQRRRAAYVSGSVGSCTATIIGPRHLLTAAHCRFSAGAKAYFYSTTSAQLDTSFYRSVSQVEVRAGVNPSSNDFESTSGDYSDVAVLTLNADIPDTSSVAEMAWLYPGASATGYRVGAGQHDNEGNPAYSLETNTDETYSSTDDTGRFYTRREETDSGDSGGPFYYNSRVLGVLSGSQLVWGAQRNRYSSVTENLASILDAMSYVGPFTVSSTGGIPASSMARFSTTGDRLCRYICEHTTNCRAISWVPTSVLPTGNCFLREASTGSVSLVSGGRTAVRQ